MPSIAGAPPVPVSPSSALKSALASPSASRAAPISSLAIWPASAATASGLDRSSTSWWWPSKSTSSSWISAVGAPASIASPSRSEPMSRGAVCSSLAAVPAPEPTAVTATSVRGTGTIAPVAVSMTSEVGAGLGADAHRAADRAEDHA